MKIGKMTVPYIENKDIVIEGIELSSGEFVELLETLKVITR